MLLSMPLILSTFDASIVKDLSDQVNTKKDGGREVRNYALAFFAYIDKVSPDDGQHG